MPDRLWKRGDRITLRYVGHSHRTVPGRPGVLQGWPYIVAEDKPSLVALWMPVGTRMKETFEQLGVWTLGWSPCAEGSNRNRIQSGSALPSRRPGCGGLPETAPTQWPRRLSQPV